MPTGTRHRDYGSGDELPLIDGDAAFRGVDERIAPALLPSGMVSKAKNLRFRNGAAEPRGGHVILPCLPTDGLTRWGEAYGAATIADPGGEEYAIIAADGGLWKVKPFMPAEQIQSPFGYLMDEDLDFLVDEDGKPLELSDGAAGVKPFYQIVQAFNTQIVIRGEDKVAMVMRNLADGFDYVEQTGQGDGTLPIPGSAFGLFLGNRMFLETARDQVVAGDVLDYTRYSQFDDFRINQGDNDRLVAMVAVADGDNSILMLKDQSCWLASNVKGDLSSLNLRNVTRKYGCVAPWSVVDFGVDVAWISERGIVTLGLTQQNELQGTARTLSDPLETTMRRVRWDHIANAVAEYHDNYLYFAVPADDPTILSRTELAPSMDYDAAEITVSGLEVGARYRYTQGRASDLYFRLGNSRYDGDADFTATSTSININGTPGEAVACSIKKILHEGVNNLVLVYDTFTQAWAGTDEFDGMNICRFFKLTINGSLRLCYVTFDGEVRIVEEHGAQDEIFSPPTPAYIDLIVVDYPHTTSGQTVQIGGGTLVSVGPGLSNAGTAWAAGGLLPDIGNRLWTDSDTGYATTNSTVWTTGGLTIQQLDRGIRVWSADATLPDVKINGVSVTSSGYYGTNVDATEPEAFCYLDCSTDQVVAQSAIATELLTRGYHGAQPWQKRFTDARLIVDTWDPTLTITAETPGPGETETLVSAWTRDRALLATGDTWATTNSGDDHGDRGREDYSVVLDDGQDGVDLGVNGVNLDQMQSYEHHESLSRTQDWFCQLRITNTTGRATVKACHVNARAGKRSYGATI